MAATLCGLPDELAVSIVEHLGQDAAALRSLALTSRRFQALAEPFLYQTLFLRQGSESENLHHALEMRPSRADAIRLIDARLSHSSNTNLHSYLAQILRRAGKLREFTLESPYCNNGQWRRASAAAPWAALMEKLLSPILRENTLSNEPDSLRSSHHHHQVMGQRPLQHLTKLTLHLNGEGREFWTVQGIYANIFTHPTLQDLHISSANLPRNSTELVLGGPKTPLKRLTLDECNITMDAFRGIMLLPTALEYLYVGENHYSSEEARFPQGQVYNDLCKQRPEAFFAALALQRHSLETLVYSPSAPDIYSCSSPLGGTCPGLSKFQRLYEVDMRGFCQSLGDVLISDMTAPPSLVKLAISGLRVENLVRWKSSEALDLLGFGRRATSASPKLEYMQLGFAGFRTESRVLAAGTHRTFIGDSGKDMRERGVTLEVFTKARQPYVRPILYGESLKEDVLVYANDEVGFRSCPEPDLRPPYVEEHDDGIDNDDEDDYQGDSYEEVSEGWETEESD